MTIRRFVCPALAALFVVWASVTSPAAPPPAASQPSDLKLYLMDGSLVTGKLSISDLAVDTPFGALKIPIDQIKSFTPGLDSHPELDKKITNLVTDLGADAFADREKAQQTLLKMGPEVRGELQRQVKSAESERLTRLQKILEELEAQREGDDDSAPAAEWTRDDVVVTNSFTVVGRITNGSFSVGSPYGILQLKLDDIREGRRDSAEPEEIRKSVTVAGSTIQQHSFESSGIRISRGDQVNVTASGNITMTPWGNVVCTPDGGNNFGMIQPGNIAGGALIAKIGGGVPFKIGSKTSFVADRSGVMEFGIAVPGDFSGNQFPGEYQVKVRVVRKP